MRLKQKHTSVRVLLFLPFLLWITIPSSSFSDSAGYLYDDTGRLVRVANADNRALYQYNEVGNLISIYEETSVPQALPPELQNIDPDILLIGARYNVVITGQNLLTTSSVVSDNSNITINSFAAIDTKLIAVMSISSSASPGSANLTVTTSYGSASMTINLYKPVITPDALGLFPAKTESLFVSLTPSASKDLKVSINNQNPDIIETPSSVTIPAGEIASFTVKTLKGGTGIITIGSAEAEIYVYENDTVMDANPVSVYIEQSTEVDATAVSSLVSAYIEQTTVVDAITASMPVSAYVQQSSIVDAISVAGQVSAYIEQATVVDATTTTIPVSVYMEPSSLVDATTVSMPVSVYIQQSSIVDVASVAGQVSAYIEQSTSVADAIIVSPLVSAIISSQ